MNRLQSFRLLPTLLLLSMVLALIPLSNTLADNNLPNSAKSKFIPVLVLMSERPDIEHLRAQVEGLPRNDRSSVVFAELCQLAERTQSSLLEYLEVEKQRGNVEFYRSIKTANGIQIRAIAEVLDEISNRPEVGQIIDDTPQKVIPQFNPVPFQELDEPDWGIERVSAPMVWDLGYTGEGVLIAHIDSGVDYTHPDVADHLWDGGEEFPNHGYDFANDDNDPTDDNGHGTHTSGIAVGDGTNGVESGVAPDATLMVLKVSTQVDEAAAATIYAAQDFAIEHGADVTTMSLGYIYDWNPNRQVWRQQYEILDAAGIVNFVASGNERSYGMEPRVPSGVPSPWQNPDDPSEGGRGGVIAVGATNDTDTYADFTSPGPVSWAEIAEYEDHPIPPGLIKPDVCAPGVAITSLALGGGYTTQEGTSMATPMVAGIACLLLSYSPELTTIEIDSILQTTALDLGIEGKDNDYGAGLVNAFSVIFARMPKGSVSGTITDANTGQPMENVQISVNCTEYPFLSSLLNTESDANGGFQIETIPGEYNLVFSYEPYQSYTSDSFQIEVDDDIPLDVTLGIGILDHQLDEILVSLSDNPEDSRSVMLYNRGTAPIDVTLKVLPDGREPEFLAEINNVDFSSVTHDQNLQGITYADGNFFVSGGNNYANPNLIYKLSSELELLGAYVQPGTEMPNANEIGMQAIAYDGHYVWGSHDQDLIAIDPVVGSEARRLIGPYTNNRAIGYDPINDLLWVTADLSDIVPIDPMTGGINTDMIIHSEMEIFGIAYYNYDADGYPLYLAVKESNTDNALYKANPFTDDIVRLGDLDFGTDSEMNGLTIIEGFQNEYDALACIVSTNSGDKLVVWQLDLFVSWASVNQANTHILPNDSSEVVITFSAAGTLPGEYRGVISAIHNTLERESEIPLHLITDYVEVEDQVNQILPTEFSLSNPYPNPFNSSTRIQYTVPYRSNIRLTVFDVLGRQVATLQSGHMDAGKYEVNFDASKLASGIYFVNMHSVDGFSHTAKMVMLK